MKWFYLFLCGLGVGLPYAFFVPFVLANGLNLSLFMEQLFATPTAAFFGMGKENKR